jgi:hypothetical protein
LFIFGKKEGIAQSTDYNLTNKKEVKFWGNKEIKLN